jgi:hypothetical protein
MSGISGQRSEAEVERTLAKARELGDPDDAGLQAQLVLDEAWMMWRYDRPEGMARMAADALARSRAVGDAELLSSALDAAAGAAWVEGRYDDAVAHSRERVELLDAAEPTGFMAFERSDAFAMLTDGLVRTGALREANRWVERNIAEIAESAPHMVGVLGLQVLYMLGEWDAALARSAGLRQAWDEAGRPPSTFYAPAIACVAAIHGLRGELSAEREWFEFSLQIGEDNPFQIPGARMWLADAALHRGEVERALGLLVPPRVDRGVPTTSGWEDQILAKRAEALVLAEAPEAEEAVELVVARRTADSHARAIGIRAQGLFARDDAMLADASARCERAELAYELARTDWLRGGVHRERAAAAFERLGAVQPG